MSIEAMKQALEALEQVTKELLAVRDELAERGARPTTNVFHQRLWDSSFSAYTDHAIPAATSLRQAIEQAEKQEPVAWQVMVEDEAMKEFSVKDAAYDFCVQEKLAGSPYSYWIRPLYTTPPAQEFVCSTGLCRFTLTQTNVGIGERGMGAYEAAKERGWVGVSDERLMEMPKQAPVECMCGICKLGKREWVSLTNEERIDILLNLNWDKKLSHMDTALAIEAKLKEKNT